MRNGDTQASYTGSDGRMYYAAHTFETRMDAERWLSNERKLIDMGEWTPPETRAAAKVARTVTVREYANKWLEAKRSAGSTLLKTAHLYRELLDGRILPALGDEAMGAVTPADVQAWWVAMGQEHDTQTRNNHAYQLLKTIFNAATADDRVTGTNPCQVSSKVAKPPKPRRVEGLTTGELATVAERVPEC